MEKKLPATLLKVGPNKTRKKVDTSMEIQNALFASHKCIKMPSIVMPVLIIKEYVQCVKVKMKFL